jgi:hypothetical protein
VTKEVADAGFADDIDANAHDTERDFWSLSLSLPLSSTFSAV